MSIKNNITKEQIKEVEEEYGKVLLKEESCMEGLNEKRSCNTQILNEDQNDFLITPSEKSEF